ncbi:MAG: molybdopterin molybdotransferase MoeA [Acidobacteria bacterium]|nr:molybdopterin molybdotransferase MoeA [Acidobacteriota bacterium]
MTSPSSFGGMRPFGDVLPLDEARCLIDEAVAPVSDRELCSLDDAKDRVLADDVPAPFDVPGFDRSAMDGYAVRSDALTEASDAHPVWLELAGHARPATGPDADVTSGSCVDIATGAPVPTGADAVVMVERTHRDEARVRFTMPATHGDHIVKRGHDVATGAIVLRRGNVLTPARLGVAASFGLRALPVLRRPIVALVASGDELLDASEHTGTPAHGHIYDSNRVMLAAICEANGAHVRRLPLVRDTIDAWRAAFDAAAAADLVVCSGGSSVGERDLCGDILAERGAVVFHGIAVKPGKPTAFARIGRQLVLAMPGNPTSCLSNAYLLLRPLVRQLASLPPLPSITRQATLTRTLTSPIDRLQIHPVRLDGEDAVPMFKGSGDVTSLSDADGYVEVPTGVTRIDAGTRVTVVLY